MSKTTSRSSRAELCLDDPCYTRAEAAAYCRCSTKTLERHRVPCQVLTRSASGVPQKVVYRRSALNAFVRSNGYPLPEIP